jgi:hypothetical protein
VLLVVWIAVAVLGLLVLGVIGFGVLGALQRLYRELQGLQTELAPVLAQVQDTAGRVAASRAHDGTETSRATGGTRFGTGDLAATDA